MDKEAIDLQELFQIVRQRKKEVVLIISLCTIAAIVTAFFVLPNTYKSTILVQAKTSNKLDVSGISDAIAAMGLGGGKSSPTVSYMELMKSRAVLDPIIEGLDWPEKSKELLNAKGFAKSNLSISNTKGTDLIEITATGKSPEEAQQIAQGVVNGFLTLMTDMNKNGQSFMVKFLSERSAAAKKDSDEAAHRLEKFSRNKKIYLPEDQAKAALEKMAIFDKIYGELRVKEESARAQMQSVTAQLAEQNANIMAFNVADNDTVQKLRSSMIDKQVDIVTLEQKYQDKHPSVIAAKEELAVLQNNLNKEVKSYVAAGTVTMNPVQAEMIKEKALAETAISVDRASIKAVQQLQDKVQDDMGKLSVDSLQYMKLKRDATIKQDVYVNLVKSLEAARIQQMMDSMDIQIVDPADFPKQPAGPRKLLITAVGIVIGAMIALGYILMIYSKRR